MHSPDKQGSETEAFAPAIHRSAIMVPCPIALGLTICERVIVEKDTENVSLIGLHTRTFVERLPGRIPPFCVSSTLTGSDGSGNVDLRIQLIRTMEVVNSYRQTVYFPNRLTEMRVIFRLNQCDAPEPGLYQVQLLVDDEWLAQRRFEVATRP